MKLRLHHIEICVQDPAKVLHTLCQQFGLELIGKRDTVTCNQLVLKQGETVFVITSKKVFGGKKRNVDGVPDHQHHEDAGQNGMLAVSGENIQEGEDNHDFPTTRIRVARRPAHEPWTVFCCETDSSSSSSSSPSHIDSVFNVAVQVENLRAIMFRLKQMGCSIVQDLTHSSDDFGTVNYAIIKSCCGNVVHTLIEKNNYDGWFLPDYERVPAPQKPAVSSIQDYDLSSNSFLDHVTLVCRAGGTDDIIRWYQDAFDMQRFITNRQDSEEDGVVIGDDVGLRLKVMEFWKCSEVGISSRGDSKEQEWEPLKIVIAESLPSVLNTQVEQFIRDHNGPGLQHIGMHTSDIITTVNGLSKRGVKFRQPPPTYYTNLGQLDAIEMAGESPDLLKQYGILLDTEADPFDEDGTQSSDSQRYLMQIFTYPIFDKDTFFLEVIQRKGARGFGVGNVTALARSVNAYQKLLQEGGAL